MIKLINDNNSDIICTRMVLFEKYDPSLSAVALTDLKTWNYQTVSMQSIYDAIDKLETCIFGELKHENSVTNFDIQLNNVSHSITNVFIKHKKIYGNIKLLNTPSGNLIKEFNKNKLNYKYSIRATGCVSNNITTVNDIITWDIII